MIKIPSYCCNGFVRGGLLIFFMLCYGQIFAQTTIWNENFTYSNDVATGTGTGVSLTSWTSGNGVLIELKHELPIPLDFGGQALLI